MVRPLSPVDGKPNRALSVAHAVGCPARLTDPLDRLRGDVSTLRARSRDRAPKTGRLCPRRRFVDALDLRAASRAIRKGGGAFIRVRFETSAAHFCARPENQFR